jgi:phage shock protein A
MTLASRLSTLFRADAHGVVDALEDKALLLRQLVREAAAEVSRKRARVEAIDGERKRLEAEAGRLDQRAAELDDDVRLALDGEKEELARFAIRRLLPLRRARKEIDARLAALARERGDLEVKIGEQEERLVELEGRVRGYLAQRAEEEREHPLAADWAVSDEDVDLELLRRKAAGGAS